MGRRGNWGVRINDGGGEGGGKDLLSFPFLPRPPPPPSFDPFLLSPQFLVRPTICAGSPRMNIQRKGVYTHYHPKTIRFKAEAHRNHDIEHFGATLCTYDADMCATLYNYNWKTRLSLFLHQLGLAIWTTSQTPLDRSAPRTITVAPRVAR